MNERRFGDEPIKILFTIEASALTAGEAGYIFNFKDADALRARRAAASGERRERLRAKGIREEEVEPGEVDEEDDTPSGAT